jgi:hypothetical protein
MLKMIRLLLLLSTLLFLTGCDDGLYSGTLIFSGEHRFESGAHFPGDVFLRAGRVEFAAGSQVDGMVVLLGGSLATNGEIGGDLFLLDGALGLLVALVLPALLVMMAFTVILIPLVIIVGLLLILFLGYGLVAIGHRLGMWLRKFVAARWGRSLSRPAATFLGTLLLALLFEIPYLGDGLLVVTAVLVSGAVMLTHFGIRRYVPPMPYDEDADSAGYGREWLQNSEQQ